MRRRRKKAGLGLIRGAKRLAGFIYDDEREFRKVYGLKAALGLFRLNGQICGRAQTITARIAAREAATAETRETA